MRLLLPFIGAIVLAITTAYAEPPSFLFITNANTISNGQIVVSALLASDSSRVRELVGSQVAFSGSGPLTPTNHTANLLISSNIVLDIELLPAGDMRRSGYVEPYYMRDMRGVYSAEVLGTLKSVDFEKRVIHVQAKREDWRLGPVF